MNKGRFREVARFLRDARANTDFSQTEVATRLGYSTPQFISNWERGIAAPPTFVLKKLAKIYSVSDEKLFRLILKETEAQMRREFKSGQLN